MLFLLPPNGKIQNCRFKEELEKKFDVSDARDSFWFVSQAVLW